MAFVEKNQAKNCPAHPKYASPSPTATAIRLIGTENIVLLGQEPLAKNRLAIISPHWRQLSHARCQS